MVCASTLVHEVEARIWYLSPLELESLAAVNLLEVLLNGEPSPHPHIQLKQVKILRRNNYKIVLESEKSGF